MELEKMTKPLSNGDFRFLRVRTIGKSLKMEGHLNPVVIDQLF